MVASSPFIVVRMISSRRPCVPGIEQEPLVEQDAEDALRLQGVAGLGERPLDQRLGFLARLSLLLEGDRLGVPGGDRVVPREIAARSFVWATSFACSSFLYDSASSPLSAFKDAANAAEPAVIAIPISTTAAARTATRGLRWHHRQSALRGAHGAGDDRLAVEEAAEVLGHRPGVGESPGGVLLEAP